MGWIPRLRPRGTTALHTTVASNAVVPRGRRRGIHPIQWNPRQWLRGMTAIVALSLLAFSLTAAHAADVYLGLQAYSQGGKPLGVGIAPFLAEPPGHEAQETARALRAVIREDLLFEHLFSITEGGPIP